MGFYWLPVFIWLALIFFASSGRFSLAKTSGQFVALGSMLLPNASSSRLLRLHVWSRKGLHWAGYFVLALLLTRALAFQFPESSELAQAGWTIGLTSLCAAADEYHQTRVPGRDGSVADVLIDIAGGLSAIGLVYC